MADRKKKAGLDAFFHDLVGMPWWVGPACAAFAFIVLRFVIPSALTGASTPDDPMAKSFGSLIVPLCGGLAPFAVLFVLVVWGIAEGKKFMDRRRLDSQTGLDSIGDLSWAEFEELVAEAYRREGYAVERTGDAAGDGGVDVVLRRYGQTTLVQCKHWKARNVGVKVVGELRGVIATRRRPARPGSRSSRPTRPTARGGRWQLRELSAIMDVCDRRKRGRGTKEQLRRLGRDYLDLRQ